MAKKTAAKPMPATSLIEIAKAIAPRKSTIWIDKLPAGARKQLLELRAAYRAGELPPHMTVSRLHSEVVEPNFPGIVSSPSFRRWMNQRSGDYA